MNQMFSLMLRYSIFLLITCQLIFLMSYICLNHFKCLRNPKSLWINNKLYVTMAMQCNVQPLQENHAEFSFGSGFWFQYSGFVVKNRFAKDLVNSLAVL